MSMANYAAQLYSLKVAIRFYTECLEAGVLCAQGSSYSERAGVWVSILPSQLGRNPILLRLLTFSPECSALAFFAFTISRSSIS